MEEINTKKIKIIHSKSPIFLEVDTFMLQLDYVPLLDKEIIINKIKLCLKEEFHITLLGNENGKLIYDSLKEKLSKDKIKDFYFELEKEIKKLIKNATIKLKEEYHFLKKDYNRNNILETRYSLIQIIKTNLIKEFHSLLRKRCVELDFDFPEPHITLYKQEENAGIGLNKKEDLRKYSIKKLKSI